jgi:hypothetical protein
VVINNFNISGIAASPGKAHAPLVINTNAGEMGNLHAKGGWQKSKWTSSN